MGFWRLFRLIVIYVIVSVTLVGWATRGNNALQKMAAIITPYTDQVSRILDIQNNQEKKITLDYYESNTTIADHEAAIILDHEADISKTTSTPKKDMYQQKNRDNEETHNMVNKKEDGSSSPRRYLFVLFNYIGPNQEYRHFRSAVVEAMYSNRSLVMPIFFALKAFQESDAYDQKNVEETFDIDQLKQIVDFATPDEYNKDCNNTIERVIVGTPDSIKNWDKFEPMYRQAYSINVPSVTDISTHLTLDKLTSVRCLGTYEPGFRHSSPSLPEDVRDELSRKLTTHYFMSKKIRKSIDSITQKMCNGEPYVAMHWRNRVQEVCMSRTCNITAYVMKMNKTSEVAAKDVTRYMAERNMTCIYLATKDENFLEIFKSAAEIPTIISTEDIKQPKYPNVDKLQEDNYFWSLIEQGICIHSKFFISWKHSGWSGTVKDFRRTINVPIDYLYQILSWTPEGIGL